MRPTGADDEAVGHEQARLLHATMDAAETDRGYLWVHCFSIGGKVSEFEVDAYLHHSLHLPRLQRDLPAQAADEILAETAPPPAPYAADVRSDRTSTAESGHGTEESASAQDSDVMDRDDPEAPVNRASAMPHPGVPATTDLPVLRHPGGERTQHRTDDEGTS